ncbi:UNVERIFIED_CONTAM: hypothetical protein RMT77_019060 [Armadillidium vulgare]
MEKDIEIPFNNCKDDLLYQNRVHSRGSKPEDLVINYFHDNEKFVNNISWPNKESDIDDDSCDDDDDDSSINITIHSQDDLSLVGLFSVSSDNCNLLNCEHFYKNNFFDHQINCSICFHKNRFDNILENDNPAIQDYIDPLYYFNMANKIPFLPRKLEIEAARKRKCDCSLHGTDIKKFHSRTESLRDIYRAKDAITEKAKNTPTEEEVIPTWIPIKEEIDTKNLISYPNSSTPNKKDPPKISLTLGYNFDLSNSEDCQWRSEINIENNFHPVTNSAFVNKSFESKLTLSPHYASQRDDIPMNSNVQNTSVNSNMLYRSSLGYSSLGENNNCNSLPNLEVISINKSCYPIVKKFNDVEEHIQWLNETEFQTGFIDTHCHLDFLFRKLNYSQSFDNFINTCQQTDPFPKSFLGCIAIFCDPRSFFKFNWWQAMLSNERVWGAFGCHPHFTHQYGPDEENMLKYALMNEKVIATGEIGLDYSYKNGRDHEQQISVFERQLIIALEVKKPIVIHCRDAFNDAYTIMKRMLPKNYIIHLHCFTGSFVEATNWMESFPNLYFGFTSIITKDNRRAMNVKQVVRALPLNRILLETDSPYFRPFYMKKGNYSHPGMAIHVASAISTLRQIPIEVVLEETRKNTFNVYNI